MESETTTMTELETEIQSEELEEDTTLSYTYDDTELLTELKAMNAQLSELQVGINYTNELLHAQANNMEVVKGCFLFALSFCAIIFVYKFLRWIF